MQFQILNQIFSNINKHFNDSHSIQIQHYLQLQYAQKAGDLGFVVFDQDEQFIDYIADYLSKQSVQRDQFYQNAAALTESARSFGADAELRL